LLTSPPSAQPACSSVPAASNRAVYPPPLQQSGGRGLSNPSALPVGLTNHLRHPLLGKHQITDLLPVQAETGHQFIAFLQQLLNRRLLVQYSREAMFVQRRAYFQIELAVHQT